MRISGSQKTLYRYSSTSSADAGAPTDSSSTPTGDASFAAAACSRLQRSNLGGLPLKLPLPAVRQRHARGRWPPATVGGRPARRSRPAGGAGEGGEHLAEVALGPEGDKTHNHAPQSRGEGDQGFQGKPGEPGHRSIGSGSCRSAW